MCLGGACVPRRSRFSSAPPSMAREMPVLRKSWTRRLRMPRRSQSQRRRFQPQPCSTSYRQRAPCPSAAARAVPGGRGRSPRACGRRSAPTPRGATRRGAARWPGAPASTPPSRSWSCRGRSSSRCRCARGAPCRGRAAPSAGPPPRRPASLREDARVRRDGHEVRDGRVPEHRLRYGVDVVDGARRMPARAQARPISRMCRGRTSASW
jgi:hypothetical protein